MEIDTPRLSTAVQWLSKTYCPTRSQNHPR